MTPSIRLAMFDLDGTLLDSIGDIIAATNYMLTELGHRAISEDRVRQLIGAGAPRLVDGALRIESPDPDPEELETALELYINHISNHINERAALFPGTLETLRELKKRGIKLAVVSNKNEALCKKALMNLGVAGLFVNIVGGDTFARRKPHPEPLLTTMVSAGVPEPAQAVMVGDSVFDVEAGKAAGVLTIGCRFGYGQPSDLEKFDYKLDRFSDLLKVPGLG